MCPAAGGLSRLGAHGAPNIVAEPSWLADFGVQKSRDERHAWRQREQQFEAALEKRLARVRAGHAPRPVQKRFRQVSISSPRRWARGSQGLNALCLHGRSLLGKGTQARLEVRQL